MSPEDRQQALRFALRVQEAFASEQRMRETMRDAAETIDRAVAKLREPAQYRYTDWFVFLKEFDGRWIAACLPMQEIEAMEELPDYDMVIPVPEPGSAPEFKGF